MPKRRSRSRPPARRAPFRAPRRRFLVVCEGRVTEPGYVRGLVRWLRNAAVEVEIAPEHGVPRTLVDVAIGRKREAEREAKRLRDDFAAYDEVWCVFDVDAHPHLLDAKQKARAHGLQLAISNPCFELWLLLHFRDSPGPRSRHQMQRLFADFVQGYAKHIDFGALSPGLDEAMSRARRLDDDARRMGEPGRNPTTGVYRLAESMARIE